MFGCWLICAYVDISNWMRFCNMSLCGCMGNRWAMLLGLSCFSLSLCCWVSMPVKIKMPRNFACWAIVSSSGLIVGL